MRFVLPRGIGDSFVCDTVPEDTLAQFWMQADDAAIFLA